MSASIRVEDLTVEAWWKVSDLGEDPLDPTCWYRSVKVEVPGDEDGIIFGIIIGDEGGPFVDVLTLEHTVTDLRVLCEVLPELTERIAALPLTRYPEQ